MMRLSRRAFVRSSMALAGAWALAGPSGFNRSGSAAAAERPRLGSVKPRGARERFVAALAEHHLLF